MKEKRLAACQRVIGYYFSNPRLLETALTHSSLRSSDRECNERLEFLGDSILGLVITEELYHLLPDQSEGELTRIKSAVVSRSALLDASLRLGLPQYAEFARGVGKRDHLPASVVANLVESVIGAIYLDAGYYPAREFVLRHLGTAIEDELHDRGAKNYKSLLQHEVQQSVGITPTYRTLEAEGPDHAKEFVVAAVIRGREWGRATGNTKKDAEQEAARKALEAWARRGRGRRRRRKRRSGQTREDELPVVTESDEIGSVEAAEPPPTDETDAPAPAEPAPSGVEEHVLGEVEETAPEPSAAEQPRQAPPKAPRRRRSRPGRVPVAERLVLPAESAAEEPAPEPAEEPAASEDEAPASKPSRKRAPRPEGESAPRASKKRAPRPEGESAPKASKKRAPRAGGEPAASPAEEAAPSEVAGPAPRPPRRRPDRAPAPTTARPETDGFAAGIDVDPRASVAPAPAEGERVRVRAPARRPAPTPTTAPDEDDGFTAGIVDD